MMKKVFSFLFLGIMMGLSAQLKWMSVDEVMMAQKSKPKKILIHFYKDSLGFKKQIEKTYQHPVLLKQLEESYYVVKFHVHDSSSIQFNGKNFQGFSKENAKEELHSFARFMRIESTPSIIFIDEKGAIITTLIGDFSAKEIEPYLFGIGSDAYKKYKNHKEWEVYLKKYQSKLID